MYELKISLICVYYIDLLRPFFFVFFCFFFLFFFCRKCALNTVT